MNNGAPVATSAILRTSSKACAVEPNGLFHFDPSLTDTSPVADVSDSEETIVFVGRRYATREKPPCKLDDTPTRSLKTAAFGPNDHAHIHSSFKQPSNELERSEEETNPISKGNNAKARPKKPPKPEALRVGSAAEHKRSSSDVTTLVPGSPSLKYENRRHRRQMSEASGDWIDLGSPKNLDDPQIEMGPAGLMWVSPKELILLEAMREDALEHQAQVSRIEALEIEVEELKIDLRSSRADMSKKKWDANNTKRQIDQLKRSLANKDELEDEIEAEKVRYVRLEKECMAAAMQCSFLRVMNNHFKGALELKDPALSDALGNALKLKDNEIQKLRSQVSRIYNAWQEDVRADEVVIVSAEFKMQGLGVALSHLAKAKDEMHERWSESEGMLSSVIDRLKSKVRMTQAMKMICAHHDHVDTSLEAATNMTRWNGEAIKIAYNAAEDHGTRLRKLQQH